MIDFAAEERDAERALREVERVTATRDRAVREATQAWEAAVARAVEGGHALEDVAAAVGLTTRELRTILRRRERQGHSPSEPER